jgi:hypothetical protein
MVTDCGVMHSSNAYVMYFNSVLQVINGRKLLLLGPLQRKSPVRRRIRTLRLLCMEA